MDNYTGQPAAMPTKVSSPSPEIRPDSAAALDTDEIADHAARMQADRELRDALAAEGFAGPAYAVFEEDLASYGYQIMKAWLKTGYIFSLCRQSGLGLVSKLVPVGDRDDLAQETVAAALEVFKRTGLQQGRWRPEGGASLRTFFIGALCHQFANIWRKRLRTWSVPTLPLEAVPPGAASPGPGPEDLAVQRDEIRRGLASIESERTRAAIVLAAEGYEHEEIAEVLGPGVTERAVEGYLRRHRRHASDGYDQREETSD
jgi:DNA-directed RNA polymerase specialized sigma24 family protein